MPRILLFITLFSWMATNGQTVTGSWYGKADVVAGRNTNNYLSELILKQKGDEVEGIFGYYFRDGYQSFLYVENMIKQRVGYVYRICL